MEDCMPRASCRPPPCKGEINTADESWTDTDGWTERWMDRDSQIQMDSELDGYR